MRPPLIAYGAVSGTLRTVYSAVTSGSKRTVTGIWRGMLLIAVSRHAPESGRSACAVEPATDARPGVRRRRQRDALADLQVEFSPLAGGRGIRIGLADVDLPVGAERSAAGSADEDVHEHALAELDVGLDGEVRVHRRGARIPGARATGGAAEHELEFANGPPPLAKRRTTVDPVAKSAAHDEGH